jgi:hypothetical protein
VGTGVDIGGNFDSRKRIQYVIHVKEPVSVPRLMEQSLLDTRRLPQNPNYSCCNW